MQEGNNPQHIHKLQVNPPKTHRKSKIHPEFRQNKTHLRAKKSKKAPMAVVKVITSASIDLWRGVNLDSKSSKNARESCQCPTLAANDDSQRCKRHAINPSFLFMFVWWYKTSKFSKVCNSFRLKTAQKNESNVLFFCGGQTLIITVLCWKFGPNS